MNGSTDGLVRTDTPMEYAQGEVGSLVEPAVANPLQQIHSLLRGRYRLASALAFIGLVVGATLGYRIPKLTYQSTGIIRVKPNLDVILYANDQNGVMPMFDAYVNSQVSLISGQRVADLAMQAPAWVALNRGLTAASEFAFTSSLAVDHPKGSELILVSFKDRDRDAARAGVSAVIDAYQRLYGENDSESTSQRLQVLDERKISLTNQLKGINDLILAIAKEYGSNNLDRRYEAKVEEFNKIESLLHQAAMATALARSGGASHATTKPSEIMVEVLALKVPEIRNLISSKRELERNLASDELRLGVEHPSVIQLRSTLDTVNRQIDELCESYRKAGPELLDSIKGAINPGASKSLEQLEAEEASIKALRDRANAEMIEIGGRCVEIESLHADSDRIKASLVDTTKRIEHLTVESSAGGRVSIDSRGDRPLTPISDKRLAMAGVGGFGAAALAIGAVLLLGLVNRRVRHISDVSHGARLSRILGVLPQLPENLDNAEEAAFAAHAVHQIRAQLQERRTGDNKPVFAITSPSPRSGKTSLVMALGISFAASGSRTLLIDCDIIGGGLTAKLKKTMRRHLGHILRSEGMITRDQLVAALKTAKQSGRRIGDVLVEMALVSEAQVEQAVLTQIESTIGIREALDGEPIGECIARTATNGLYIMPLGSAERHHVGQLSYSGMKKVVEQARQLFDVILIDTGPVLGSLEASVAAIASDAVVFTISRGELQSSMQRALDDLIARGANIAGIVLNRADRGDIATSGYSSSVSRLSLDRTDRGAAFATAHKEHDSLRLGPIGAAVFATTEIKRLDPPSKVPA